jgi:hypothetical protein
MSKIAVWAALCAALLAAFATSGAVAAHKKKPLIVSPKTGEVIGARPVRVRIHAGHARELHAQLNGHPIARYFSRPNGRGIRTLRVTPAYGLRHGKNRLHVRVRRIGGRRASRWSRFRIRRNAPLAAAGFPQRVEVGQKVYLDGRRSRSHLRSRTLPQDGGHGKSHRPGLDHHWAVVTAPKGAPPGNASMTGADTATPVLKTTVPGRYRIRLTVTARDGAKSSDTIPVDALSPPLVTVDTMAKDNGHQAIEVNGTPYDVPWDVPYSIFQILVLDRKTLQEESNVLCKQTAPPEPVCSTGSEQGALLSDYLKQWSSDDLVIVSSQPNALFIGPDASLAGAFTSIGVPKLGFTNDTKPGTFSAIGVPGLPSGQADYKFVDANPGSGRMEGFLTRAETGKVGDNGLYTWLPSQRVPFDTRVGGSCGANTWSNDMQVGDKRYHDEVSPPAGGFAVVVLDRFTLELVDKSMFFTNFHDHNDVDAPEVQRMTDFLNHQTKGNIIMISALDCGPPIGASIGLGPLQQLALAVRDAGGSFHGFIASVTRSNFGSNSKYSMIGWAGAGELNGVETDAVRDPSSGDGRLRGVLVPEHDQQFRPTDASAVNQPSEALADTLVQPATKWPLDGDPAAQNALTYLGSQDKQLGPYPRTAYWLSTNTPADWAQLQITIGKVEWPGSAKAGCSNGQPQPGGFCLADFNAAKAELLQEMAWVEKTRSYLDILSDPLNDNAFQSWDKLAVVTDRVLASLNPPDEQSRFSVPDFIEGVYGLVGAFGGEEIEPVIEAFSSMFRIANSFFSEKPDGSDADEVRAKAHELAAAAKENLLQTRDSFKRIGDAITSDYGKLKTVGTYAKCNPTDPSCPRQWQFTPDDQTATTNAIWKGIESQFYEELLGLDFKTYFLCAKQGPNDGTGCGLQSSDQTNPANYSCSYFPDINHEYDVYVFGDNVPARSYVSLPAGPGLFDTFILFRPQPQTKVRPDSGGQVAPSAITDRMFGPVSESKDPTMGGLGIYAPDYLVQSYDHGSAGIPVLNGLTRVDGGWDSCEWKPR